MHTQQQSFLAYSKSPSIAIGTQIQVNMAHGVLEASKKHVAILALAPFVTLASEMIYLMKHVSMVAEPIILGPSVMIGSIFSKRYRFSYGMQRLVFGLSLSVAHLAITTMINVPMLPVRLLGSIFIPTTSLQSIADGD
jgi:hypothetical protein